LQCFAGSVGKSLFGGEREGWHDATFLRVLGIAKSVGCRFHFASDAHSLAEIGAVTKLAPFVKELGLTPKDITPLARV